MRVFEHKKKVHKGFTSKYNVDKLGFYEWHNTIGGAIAHEKRIKNSSREKKLDLIEGMNPEWADLYGEFV
jgi:putative endonuclease